MALKTMIIGENVNRWKLFFSLLLIFIGSVISSKFDCWYAIGGGAILAVLGSYFSTRSVRWVTDRN
jgi:hypothetical protein